MLPAIALVELPVEAEGVAPVCPVVEDAEFGDTPLGWAEVPFGALLFGEAPFGDAPLGTDPPGDVPVGETPVAGVALDGGVVCGWLGLDETAPACAPVEVCAPGVIPVVALDAAPG